MKIFTFFSLLFVIAFGSIIATPNNANSIEFFTINTETDELFKINPEHNQLIKIGSLNHNTLNTELIFFQNQLIVLNGDIDNSNAELLIINPKEGKTINSTKLFYNEMPVVHVEGVVIHNNSLLISFSTDTSKGSGMIGNLSINGTISSVVEFENYDFDGLAIGSISEAIYGIDSQPEENLVKLYEITLENSSIKEVSTLPYEAYRANDLYFFQDTVYFLDHFNLKIHKFLLDNNGISLIKSYDLNASFWGLASTSNFCDIIDSDRDGVIDEWDQCPETISDSWINHVGCPSTGLYTEDQMNQMVNTILTWGDLNGDNKINLIEAIKALRLVSGVTEPSIKIETSDK